MSQINGPWGYCYIDTLVLVSLDFSGPLGDDGLCLKAIHQPSEPCYVDHLNGNEGDACHLYTNTKIDGLSEVV